MRPIVLLDGRWMRRVVILNRYADGYLFGGERINIEPVSFGLNSVRPSGRTLSRVFTEKACALAKIRRDTPAP